MDLREQIKELLDKQVSGKHVESLTDSIMNLVVQTDPNLSDAPSLLKTIDALKKELLDVNGRVASLEIYWSNLQSAFVSPTVAATLPATPQSIPATTSSDTKDFLTSDELVFFKDKCVIEKDDALKVVTSVRLKDLTNPYKLDGSSFRIVVVEGGKQKRFNKEKLYTALYGDNFPQV